MNLQYLKYFQTVAEHQNISLAAEELFLSQPYLSKVIGNLENELGVHLFDRIGRTIRLNSYGRELLKTAQAIFGEMAELESKFAKIREQETKKITLALNIPSLLPLLLKNYLARHSAISVNNVNGSNSRLRKMIEMGQVDFCISSPPVTGERITFISLATEELKLFLPPGHPYTGHSGPVPLSEFRHDPFLVFKKDHGIRDVVDEIFRQAGFTPEIKYESEVNDSLINLVKLGMGVSLLPAHKWDHSKESCCSVSISFPKCERTIGLSFLQDKELSPAAKEFQEYVVQMFRFSQDSIGV